MEFLKCWCVYLITVCLDLYTSIGKNLLQLCILQTFIRSASICFIVKKEDEDFLLLILIHNLHSSKVIDISYKYEICNIVNIIRWLKISFIKYRSIAVLIAHLLFTYLIDAIFYLYFYDCHNLTFRFWNIIILINIILQYSNGIYHR